MPRVDLVMESDIIRSPRHADRGFRRVGEKSIVQLRTF